jgi:RNA polymerase sigma-70 factor (ECF subfamily)
LENLSDQQLIDAVLSGEDARYSLLVKRYQRAVYVIAIRYLQDHEAADDIVQETFIKAYFSLKTYNNQYRFYTWVLRITVNLCHDARKKMDRYMPLDDNQQSSVGEDPLENTIQNDACNKIRNEISDLPDDQRDIILLRVDKELSYEEISQVLNIPLGTVMSRLFRGRKTLMERLKGIL